MDYNSIAAEAIRERDMLRSRNEELKERVFVRGKQYMIATEQAAEYANKVILLEHDLTTAQRRIKELVKFIEELTEDNKKWAVAVWLYREELEGWMQLREAVVEIRDLAFSLNPDRWKTIRATDIAHRALDKLKGGE